MAEIPLRTYIEEINGLVDKKQVDEAIAHCKHVLTYYPKHLGTYQALGKALLEKGRHADAADIFQRVLSAIPDDYVSHVGMSIVREDESNVEGALWHMERAFEVMPSNTAIQEELRRLYGRRDGVMPPRTRLTRGALARLYAKGALYAQAEAELKKALADDPDRFDLANILAQVYWQTNRRKEAAAVCTNIVEKLPYNQEANRMLADLLLAQGRTDELVPYRQRLEALDPYAAFAEPGTDGHGAESVKADAVLIPKLVYTPDMAASDASTPEWVASIGAKLEESGRAPTTEASDWLPTPPASPAGAESSLAAAENLPEWLQGAQVALGNEPLEAASTMPLGPSPVPAKPAAESEMPDWMKSTITTPLEMPDWMKAAPAPQEPAPAPAPEAVPDWMNAAMSPSDETPDWMKDMAQTPGTTDQTAAAAFSIPASPEAPSAAAPEPGMMNEDEALSWLEGLALQQGANPEELVTRPQDRATPAGQVQPAVQATAEAPSAAAPAPAEELPDWLKAAEATPAEELPEWLKQPTPPQAAEAAPALAVAPEPGEMNADEALSWLEGLALQQGANPEELVTRPQDRATPAEQVPPAVQATAEAPSAATPALAEELPDWLKAAEATPAEELPEWLKQPTPPQAAEAAPALAVAPEPGEMNADEALSWLEGLALQQGANPEELVTRPQDRATPAEQVPPAVQATAEAPSAATPAPAEELPDWLKAAEATPAEELPEWLKQPAPLTESAIPELEAAVPASADELPDWLRPPQAAPANVEKTAWLEPMEGEAKAPEIAPAQPPVMELATPAAEADKPDWLKQMEAEADAYEASLGLAPQAEVPPLPTPAAPSAKPKVRADELPDFLQLATPEALARAEQPTHLAEELEQEQLLSEAAEPSLAAAEIPDWLKGMAPAAEMPAAEAPAAPAETIEWLHSESPMPEVKPQEAAPAEPAPAEEVPEWIKVPTEQAGEESASDLPTWVEEPPPGPPDTVSLWLAQQKLPEWLRRPDEEPAEAQPPVEWLRAPVEETPKAEAPAPEVPPVSTLPPAAPEAPTGVKVEEPVAEPEKRPAKPSASSLEESVTKPLGPLPPWPPVEKPATPEAPVMPAPAEAAVSAEAMSEDEALRWLEGLALQQGANPEELITKPEERPAQPPAWVAAEAAAAEAPLTPPEAAPEAEVLSMAEAPAASALAEPAAMSEDEALRWLESLALQQGANPEELITKPEERPAQPPAWVAAEAAAAEAQPPTPSATPEPEVKAPPAPVKMVEPEPELPRLSFTTIPPEPVTQPEPVMKPEPPKPEPAVEAPPAEAAKDERLSKLAEKLAANRRAKDAEIEAKFEAKRAEREAARRSVQQKLERKPAATPSAPEPAPQEPSQPMPVAEKPAPGPVIVEIAKPASASQPAAAPTAKPGPALRAPSVPKPKAKAPAPALKPKKVRLSKSPYAAEPPENVFALARQRIADNDDAGAAEAFTYLVASGHMVHETISEVEMSTAQRHSAPLLQVLGDAYMKNNQLQQALEAYRQALGHL